MRNPSSRSSAAVTRGKREISLRYFLSDSELLPRGSSRSFSMRVPPAAEYSTRVAPDIRSRSADRDADGALSVAAAQGQHHAEHPVAVARRDLLAIHGRREAEASHEPPAGTLHAMEPLASTLALEPALALDHE